VSALVPSDVHHAASRSWLEQRAADQLLVAPSLLLPEVASAVSRATGRPLLARRAVQLLSRLPALRIVAVDSELAEAAARLAGDRRLRGADSVYVVLPKRLSLPLATWDLEQASRASEVNAGAPGVERE
jgi:predicted nucleic acid-binding protein